MPPGTLTVRPFGLNDVISILNHELAVAARPRRLAPMLDRLAFRAEAGHRLVIVLPHQMPQAVARLDEIALAIHGRLRWLFFRTNVSCSATVPGVPIGKGMLRAPIQNRNWFPDLFAMRRHKCKGAPSRGPFVVGCGDLHRVRFWIRPKLTTPHAIADSGDVITLATRSRPKT